MFLEDISDYLRTGLFVLLELLFEGEDGDIVLGSQFLRVFLDLEVEDVLETLNLTLEDSEVELLLNHWVIVVVPHKTELFEVARHGEVFSIILEDELQDFALHEETVYSRNIYVTIRLSVLFEASVIRVLWGGLGIFFGKGFLLAFTFILATLHVLGLSHEVRSVLGQLW